MGSRADGSCTTAYDEVVIVNTFVFWTIITFYLLLLLIYCIRKLQYYHVYDKCNSMSYHFRYDFHIVVGRQAINYNRLESHLIIDLLDNQGVSTMSIQIPGSTIFNDNQPFMYRHEKPNLRCCSFSVYRKHPIRDVRAVRIAHSCSNPDTRLFVYGINLHDLTSSENKFFPITSPVKYRGTQWALNTTFEPRTEASFAKFGCGCYDPFGVTLLPTHMEMLLISFYLWSSDLFFGYIITVASLGSIYVHAIVIFITSASTAAIIIALYARLIKYKVLDQHYDGPYTSLERTLVMAVVLSASIVFWILTYGQVNSCREDSIRWLQSSLISTLALTLVLYLTKLLGARWKDVLDERVLNEYEANLAKTSSHPNLEYTDEKPVGFFSKAGNSQRKSTESRSTKTAASGQPRKKSSGRQHGAKQASESLDGAFGPETPYVKTKNRNSISQYI